jgi:hypothetical protein
MMKLEPSDNRVQEISSNRTIKRYSKKKRNSHRRKLKKQGKKKGGGGE